MRTVIGITPEHVGQYCNHRCAIAAVAEINKRVRTVEAVIGDAGSWRINEGQRDAVERAMDHADHACESATVSAQTVRG